MNNLEGKINIYRPGGSDDVIITIEDGGSGIQFLELRLTLKDYALATTGMGDVRGRLTLCGMSAVGKIREHKTELVPVPEGDYKSREERGKAAIAPFEVDGWRGRVDDTHNYHNRQKGSKGTPLYKVVFIRHVDAPADKA